MHFIADMICMPFYIKHKQFDVVIMLGFLMTIALSKITLTLELMMHDLLRHKLERIARELGTVVTYRDVEDQYSTWKEIHIEYGHEMKERE